MAEGQEVDGTLSGRGPRGGWHSEPSLSPQTGTMYVACMGGLSQRPAAGETECPHLANGALQQRRETALIKTLDWVVLVLGDSGCREVKYM